SESQEQASSDSPSKEVVVFSSRKQHLIEPLFDQFTEETGIKVKYITDNAQPLLARITASAGQSEADVFMAVDAGSLWSAASQNLLQSVKSEVLNERVPEALRDENGLWF